MEAAAPRDHGRSNQLDVRTGHGVARVIQHSTSDHGCRPQLQHEALRVLILTGDNGARRLRVAGGEKPAPPGSEFELARRKARKRETPIFACDQCLLPVRAVGRGNHEAYVCEGLSADAILYHAGDGVFAGSFGAGGQRPEKPQESHGASSGAIFKAID